MTMQAARYGVWIGMACAVLAWAGLANAGQHSWDVNEVFSNATGTIQFVELVEAAGAPNELGITSQTLSSTSAPGFVLSGGTTVTSPTSNKFFLVATPGFAALPGAPTPDKLIPAGSIPFVNTAGDTVTYGPYDSWTFGAIPTDGINSFNRTGPTTGVSGTNSPTNFAGTSGSVNAAPPSVPSSSLPAALLMLAVMSGTGLLATRRLRRTAG